ncbi:hypothetical protein SNE40_022619 [Patella caerulea]|uniref:Uncharacterized protein n=1 Tax=Patella caerulea TaxID=87958 RepID=A0AAN8G140_PATCE
MHFICSLPNGKSSTVVFDRTDTLQSAAENPPGSECMGCSQFYQRQLSPNFDEKFKKSVALINLKTERYPEKKKLLIPKRYPKISID